MTMVIDTHLHIWSADRTRYPFAAGRDPDAAAPVEQLVETMDDAGVDRAVIVQPAHYLYDNRYVIDSRRRFPDRLAAVGLVDRHAPDAPEQLTHLVRDEGFSGLRLHLARPDDPAEWAAPDQYPIWDCAQELDVCFQVYGPARLLPAIEPIIARYPEVTVVLDHNGGADLADGSELEYVAGLARYPRLYVKLTPQPHRSSEPFPHADIFPLYRRLFDAFGPRRLMWGTNFPGVLKGLGYPRALELFRDHLGFLSPSDRDWLLGQTALQVWRFGPAGRQRTV